MSDIFMQRQRGVILMSCQGIVNSHLACLRWTGEFHHPASLLKSAQTFKFYQERTPKAERLKEYPRENCKKLGTEG